MTIWYSKNKDSVSQKIGSLSASSLNNSNSQQSNINEILLVDCSSNEVLVSPPNNPAVNDTFGVSDAVGKSNSNNITIDFSFHNLNSNPTVYVMNSNNSIAFFQYVNSTIGWISRN